MLLPPDMLDKLHYYHHDIKEGCIVRDDIVTIEYQGWIFKKTKKFKFRRRCKFHTNTATFVYSMADECQELLTQLNKKMREKNDSPEINT